MRKVSEAHFCKVDIENNPQESEENRKNLGEIVCAAFHQSKRKDRERDNLRMEFLARGFSFGPLQSGALEKLPLILGGEIAPSPDWKGKNWKRHYFKRPME